MLPRPLRLPLLTALLIGLLAGAPLHAQDSPVMHPWNTLTPAQRWQQMTPEERQQARQNQHLYDTLPPAKQQQLHDAFQRFQQLPPEQRDELRRQWQQQSPEERQHWLQHMGPNSTLPAKHAFGMPGR